MSREWVRVRVIEDGSATTYVYREVGAENRKARLLRSALRLAAGVTLAASFATLTLWAWPRAVRGVVGLAGYELPQVEVRR